jgi:hypothetical protein
LNGNLSTVSSYYFAILFASLANLALAAVALFQREKQIRGNKLRERQVQLAESRNELAEERLRSLRDQITLLSEIRDALCPNSPARLRGRAPMGQKNVVPTSRPPSQKSLHA